MTLEKGHLNQEITLVRNEDDQLILTYHNLKKPPYILCADSFQELYSTIVSKIKLTEKEIERRSKNSVFYKFFSESNEAFNKMLSFFENYDVL